jgi:hypothetical protein
MNRDTLLPAILAVCVVNGIFSPYLIIAIPITDALLPEMFPRNISWVLFFSSILVATTTLLVSGVPAAIYERLVDSDPASPIATWIWLGGAALLSLPALNTVARL